jgi:YHS domain-containing protein
MQVDKRKAKFTSEYKRETYYFCSLFCKKEFDKKLIEEPSYVDIYGINTDKIQILYRNGSPGAPEGNTSKN